MPHDSSLPAAASGKAFFLGVLAAALALALGVGAYAAYATHHAERAIVATLEAETADFVARDLDAWARHWRHSPTTQKSYHGGGGGGQALLGWAAVRRYARDYLAAHPGPITVPPSNHDYRVDRLGRDVAAVDYSYDGPDGRVRESRLLVRERGRWRIARMATVKP